MGAQKTTSSGGVSAPSEHKHEVLGIVALAVAVLLTLALGAYQFQFLSNPIGPFGQRFGYTATAALGLTAWLLPLEGFLLSWRLFRQQPTNLGFGALFSSIAFVIVGCALMQLAMGSNPVIDDHLAGGVVGEFFGEVFRSIFGTVGSAIVCGTVLVAMLIIRTPFSLKQTLDAVLRLARGIGAACSHAVTSLIDAWREARDVDLAQKESAIAEIAASKSTGPKIVGIDDEDGEFDEEAEFDEDDDEEFEDEDDDEADKTESRVAPPFSILKLKGSKAKASNKNTEERTTNGRSDDSEPKIIAPKPTRQAPKPSKCRRASSAEPSLYHRRRFSKSRASR
ncbi:MAG: DNA translocase FtsK 4TM domain-containing protein [Polyangiales bacterium]